MRERTSKGLSTGQIDKLRRRVERRMDQGVPFKLWDHAEQQYHAFYVTGGACASCAAPNAIIKKEEVDGELSDN